MKLRQKSSRRLQTLFCDDEKSRSERCDHTDGRMCEKSRIKRGDPNEKTVRFLQKCFLP